MQSKSLHGDPAAALLEVLDPEQNHNFVDQYPFECLIVKILQEWLTSKAVFMTQVLSTHWNNSIAVWSYALIISGLLPTYSSLILETYRLIYQLHSCLYHLFFLYHWSRPPHHIQTAIPHSDHHLTFRLPIHIQTVIQIPEMFIQPEPDLKMPLLHHLHM